MNWVKENFSKAPAKPKGWVTISDIVKQTGNNRKSVETKLREMVDNGQLEVMECMENKHRAKCYRQKIKK